MHPQSSSTVSHGSSCRSILSERSNDKLCRQRKRLIRSESGGFITFHAVDGSGYVRILKPEVVASMKQRFSEADLAAVPDYVEHLLIGLDSITYYGDKR